MGRFRFFSRYSTLREALYVLSRPALWHRRPLSKHELATDPFEQFRRWYQRAKRTVSLEFPNAMALSTISADGYPQSRMVLLKSYDREGFVFYTNLDSDKGVAIRNCPRVSLLFYWEPLQRQVRITGDAELVPDAEADAYFATRPRESRIGAWSSRQSRVLTSRVELEEAVRARSAEFEGREVPRPPHWSGYRVVPKVFEYWQLRLNRLHDRFRYRREADGTWVVERLSP